MKYCRVVVSPLRELLLTIQKNNARDKNEIRIVHVHKLMCVNFNEGILLIVLTVRTGLSGFAPAFPQAY